MPLNGDKTVTLPPPFDREIDGWSSLRGSGNRCQARVVWPVMLPVGHPWNLRLSQHSSHLLLNTTTRSPLEAVVMNRREGPPPTSEKYFAGEWRSLIGSRPPFLTQFFLIVLSQGSSGQVTLCIYSHRLLSCYYFLLRCFLSTGSYQFLSFSRGILPC